MQLEEFQILFKEHYTAIKNFLYYKIGDIDMSEDIAQDAFMKLWEKREEVNKETVKSYLYTIANNMMLNKIRHNKVVISFAEKQKPHQDEQSPHYNLEEKEFKEELERVISDMPEKQRVVFLMNRMDEMTYKEIAVTLDLSVKAIEKRMHGALNHLKKHIDHKI